MNMLDATLAFVLTIAALATVVTLLMETIHRIIRVRKGNLFSVLKGLNNEIPNGLFKLNSQQRWDFITHVLNNPTVTKGHLPTSTEITEIIDKGKPLPNAIKKQPDFENIVQCKQPTEDNWENLIENIGMRQRTRGIYDKVSLEHVLRRFTELPEVQKMVVASQKKAKEELDRISRKFEEFSSAASADFKRRSQFWSIVIGVILAFAINIDALRIFQSYLTDQKLTQTIIAQYPKLEESAEKINQRTDKLLEDTKNQSMENDKVSKQLEQAEAALKQSSATLASLTNLGVPIGSGYFPHCIIASSLSNEDVCILGEDNGKFGRYLSWVVSSLFTGFLIGLGAPFWFDVAKRLAAVRSMLSGTAPTEQRMSGKNADGNHKKRRVMVAQVVADTILAPQPMQGNEQQKNKTVLSKEK